MTGGSAVTAALVMDACPGALLIDAPLHPHHVPRPLAGPAYTVRHESDDNLALHHAAARAPAGSVIVSATGTPGGVGIWGELLTAAAAARGVAGLVTDGCVRDVADIVRGDFAVVAAGRDPRRARKGDPGLHGAPVLLGGVEIAAGDLVVADGDGVVVVPQAEADAAVGAARALARREEELRSRIEAGAGTIELLGLPADPPGQEPEGIA